MMTTAPWLNQIFRFALLFFAFLFSSSLFGAFLYFRLVHFLLLSPFYLSRPPSAHLRYMQVTFVASYIHAGYFANDDMVKLL